ncbi:MAG: porin family protein [Candidatus Cryptobacteroides sp.]
MLGNAEEEVPPYLSDRVFERVDLMSGQGGGRRPVPVWLRWAVPVTAIAAALLLAVLLWPESGIRQVDVQDVTAMVEDREPVLEVADEVGGPVEEDRTVREMQESVMTSKSGSRTPEYVKSVPEAEAIAGHMVEEVEAVTEEPEEAGSASDAAEDVQEDIEESEERVAEPYGEDSRQVSAEDIKEGRWDGPSDDVVEDSDSYEKVSLVLGGDVSGNGNAKGIGRFGGFRAPAMGVRNDTWIEQTGTESSYAIPVTFGLGVRVSLTERWSLGTGLNYTMLQRTFSGVYTKVQNGETVTKLSSDVRNSLHYIGIPVNVYFDIVSGNHFKLYAYGGGTFEKGVKNSFRVKNSPEDILLSEKVKGVQMSAGAGLGVEFVVAKSFGIYLDPGFRYYFDCDQPVSIRTQQPFTMNFELGLRVDL